MNFIESVLDTFLVQEKARVKKRNEDAKIIVAAYHSRGKFITEEENIIPSSKKVICKSREDVFFIGGHVVANLDKDYEEKDIQRILRDFNISRNEYNHFLYAVKPITAALVDMKYLSRIDGSFCVETQDEMFYRLKDSFFLPIRTLSVSDHLNIVSINGKRYSVLGVHYEDDFTGPRVKYMVERNGVKTRIDSRNIDFFNT